MSVEQTKWVRIKNLPDGYFKERLSQMVICPESEVCVVAKAGIIDDWAAYIGWPTIEQIKPELCTHDAFYYTSHHHTAQQVADHGDKLSASEAHALFPLFDISMYRR